jgi:hypothetical protein
VTGKCGDIDGVWIDPVTAQVMITLRVLMAADPQGRTDEGESEGERAKDATLAAVSGD